MASSRAAAITARAQARFGPRAFPSGAESFISSEAPDPFVPGNFSVPTELIAAPLSILAHARQKRLDKQLAERAGLQDQLVHAQIENLNRSNQPKQSYSLEFPGEDTGITGPIQPRTVTGTSQELEQFGTAYKAAHPQAKTFTPTDPALLEMRARVAAEIARHNKAMEGIGRTRAEHGSGSAEWHAAQAGLRNLASDETAKGTEIANMGDFRAQQLMNDAIHGKGAQKADAIATLGLPPNVTDPQEIINAADHWRQRFVRSGKEGVRTGNAAKRAQYEAVTDTGAGLQAPEENEYQTFLQGLKEVFGEAPAAEEPSP